MDVQAPRFIDPAELARIAHLPLIARTVVAGLGTGLHRGWRTGGAAEFAQYRPYVPGDDPRRLDWRLYGRSDRLHIRQFDEETNLACTVLLDCSGSMDYGSGAVDKFRYGQMLAACLVWLAAAQGDAVGLIAFADKVLYAEPARRQAGQSQRLLARLQGLEAQGCTAADGALAYAAQALPARGLVIVISDLLQPVDTLDASLRQLGARRHDTLVLQISDPAEETFPFAGILELVDAEDGRQIVAVPQAVRQGYLENRQRHFQQLRRVCLEAAIDLAEFTCSRPLDLALHHYIHRRRRLLRARGRQGWSQGA